MQNQPSRIILDTNLRISFLITKDFSKLDEIIFSKKSVLLFSKELFDEFLEVTKRTKLRRYFKQTDVEELLENIDEYGYFVDVKIKLNTCRDEKDNFLLSLSVDGNADFLLTGDKDLLVLNQVVKKKLLQSRHFWKMI